MNAWRVQLFRASRSRPEAGFSIIELMMVITILGILLGIGIPAFRELQQNNSIVANNNDLVGALSYARSEAVKRVGPVTVCPSTNSTSCSAAVNWSTGWIVFPDPNANSTVDAGETILQVNSAAAGGVTLTGSAGLTSVRFTGTGMLGTAIGTFTVTKPGCTGDKARLIDIAVTGRVSTTRTNC